jgi:hypothetical protein
VPFGPSVVCHYVKDYIIYTATCALSKGIWIMRSMSAPLDTAAIMEG